MIEAIRVKLRGKGRVDYYAPGNSPLVRDDYVIMQTDRNYDFGKVVSNIEVLRDEDLKGSLNKIIRKCTEGDVHQIEANKARCLEAEELCARKIKELDVPMKLIEGEYSFDRSKITFYFTAEGRVDFRVLVRELAGVLRTRIQLEQIGSRDHAKRLDGFGICGRHLCCSSFMESFQPVTVKMAKEQNLPANPGKLSGLCGRLMCCLRYEYALYKEIGKKLPRIGDVIDTDRGRARVLEINHIKVTVFVENEDGGQYNISFGEKEPESEENE